MKPGKKGADNKEAFQHKNQGKVPNYLNRFNKQREDQVK